DRRAIASLAVEGATLAQTVDETTRRIAHELAPDRALDPRHATPRAQALYRLGDVQRRNANFFKAPPHLEPSGVTDPKLFEGWYALAVARSWVLAPESSVFDAVTHARATAPTEVERALVDAVARYLHHDMAGARALLEPLLARQGLST